MPRDKTTIIAPPSPTAAEASSDSEHCGPACAAVSALVKGLRGSGSGTGGSVCRVFQKCDRRFYAGIAAGVVTGTAIGFGVLYVVGGYRPGFSANSALRR